MAYNGWKNYETWNVVLWLGNDEWIYRRARVQALAEQHQLSPAAAEEFVRDILPNGTPAFEDRGGSAAYDLVDWAEVAAWFNEE